MILTAGNFSESSKRFWELLKGLYIDHIISVASNLFQLIPVLFSFTTNANNHTMNIFLL